MGGMGGMPPGMEQMFQGMDPSMMGGGNQEDFMQYMNQMMQNEDFMSQVQNLAQQPEFKNMMMEFSGKMMKKEYMYDYVTMMITK
jgi:hypothetical protein